MSDANAAEARRRLELSEGDSVRRRRGKGCVERNEPGPLRPLAMFDTARLAVFLTRPRCRGCSSAAKSIFCSASVLSRVAWVQPNSIVKPQSIECGAGLLSGCSPETEAY